MGWPAGPYDAHLVGDTGVGFLAVGVVLLLAAMWLDTRLIHAAVVAAAVHGAPHLLFHLRYSNEALRSVDTWVNSGGLTFGVLVALVVLVVSSRSPDKAAAHTSVNRSGPSDLQLQTPERKDIMKLERRFGWLAGLSAAVTLLVGVPPAAAAPSVVTTSGPLTDLLPAAHATDGGQAQFFAVAPGDGNTYVVFILTGLDPAFAGTTYGAHVHVGPCVPGQGSRALGHYNTGTGGEPSPENEVWLDFTVLPGGVGVAYASAPFEIAPGTAQSVVIHADPTQPGTGLAGGRIACLPVDF